MRRPNILVIWTDQQRGDCLGLLNPRLHTPAFDRLGAVSTVFTSAWCTQPVCTPARASVMTGLWPHQHGCWLNNTPLPTAHPTIPELLPAGQWSTGHIGKWHLGDELFPQRGFAHWVGTEDDYQRFFSPGRDRSVRSPYHHWLERIGYTPDEEGWFDRWFCLQMPEAHTKPAFAANSAIDFLAAQGDRPWFLVVNTLEPHHPNTSPRNRQYDPQAMELPPAALADVPAAAFRRVHDLRAVQDARGIDGIRYRTPDQLRAAIARYYGLISLVDSHYGRILDHLHRSGQFDDTLILFTSDHGELLGQFGLWGKGVPYTAAAHIPLMIKLPGQREARRHAHPVSQVDVVPTLLDALGLAVPARLPGRSLLAACRGDELPAQDTVYLWEESDPRKPFADAAEAQIKASTRTLISADNRWRYTVNAVGERELFDLRADPAQADNLATRADQAAAVRDLHARLTAWQRATDDRLALPVR